jgi:hypothetical protein
MSKRVAVLFSGGLDSTYLVWKNLKDGNHVVPIYVEIENNHIKTVLEKNRVELLHKEFEKEFPCDYDGRKIRDINYALKVSVGTSESSLYFKQMPIWIFALMYCQSLEIDELQIGYVGNDDAISYLNDLQNIYNSYQPIFETMKPLAFPLSKYHKYMMVTELPKQYLKLVVSCEQPTIVGKEDVEIIQYEPCGVCTPCKNIIAGNYYGSNNFPEYYKKAVKRYHAAGLRNIGYKIINEKGEDIGKWDDMFKKEIKKPYQLELQFEPNEIKTGCTCIESTITIMPIGISEPELDTDINKK